MKNKTKQWRRLDPGKPRGSAFTIPKIPHPLIYELLSQVTTNKPIQQEQPTE